MAKSFVLGNGSIAVGLDLYGQVYDLYFPYVGLENHTGGRFVHKIGVWIDNKFSWIDDDSWEITFKYFDERNDIIEYIYAKNNDLQLDLEFSDEVYNEKNVFLRQVKIINNADNEREIRLFFNQQFEIYESRRGDTAYYDPENNVVVHYKGRRIFLINAVNRSNKVPFDQYSIGLFEIEGKQGTYKDAEDGYLERNPIEHGLTDSVIGLSMNIPGNSSRYVDYWMAIAKTMDEVYQINNHVLLRTPPYLIRSARNYWKAWVKRQEYDFKNLEHDDISLFYNSLKLLRIHTDNTGAVIASSDSDLLKYGRDAYSYVWPRDAAFVSMAFSKTGYDDTNKKVFEFFNDTITKEGYFMHKYRSDKSQGSSWHPWIYKGIKELPIQLDETALVVNAIWEDFSYSKDVEFIETIYNTLILRATDFLISRVNPTTGLVKPSYDLWEEGFGTTTFTSSAVYGAFNAAAQFARIFGKEDKAQEYIYYATIVRKAILNSLYIPEKNYFYKLILEKYWEHETHVDDRVDASSLYGLFKFKVLDIFDEKLINMQNAVRDRLMCKNEVGGIPRYEGDEYFLVTKSVQGNPWIITTMWFAQLVIAQAKSIEELSEAKSCIKWARSHASRSGVLPEQLNPDTGAPLSATPLSWSHAEYVVTVLDYIKKYGELEKAHSV